MKIILIDAKNAMFRYGYAQRFLETEDGVKTGAVYGVLNCLLRMKKRYPDGKFVFVWDGENKYNSWRFKLQPLALSEIADVKASPKLERYAVKAPVAYQEKRRKKEAESKPVEVIDILSQIPLLEELLVPLGIPQIKVSEVEADDVIGILAMKCLKRGWEPIIYSSDKDFIQLLRYGITVLRNVDKKDRFAPETRVTVLAKFGCEPVNLIKVRAIAGDPTDGLPNPVRGIGVKTAAKLVEAGIDPSGDEQPTELGKLTAVWEKLLPGWKQVQRNYELMRIPLRCKDKVFSNKNKKELLHKVLPLVKVLEQEFPRVYRRGALEIMARLQLAEAIHERAALFGLQRVAGVYPLAGRAQQHHARGNVSERAV